jgi:hypothetical protein
MIFGSVLLTIECRLRNCSGLGLGYARGLIESRMIPAMAMYVLVLMRGTRLEGRTGYQRNPSK